MTVARARPTLRRRRPGRRPRRRAAACSSPPSGRSRSTPGRGPSAGRGRAGAAPTRGTARRSPTVPPSRCRAAPRWTRRHAPRVQLGDCGDDGDRGRGDGLAAVVGAGTSQPRGRDARAVGRFGRGTRGGRGGHRFVSRRTVRRRRSGRVGPIVPGLSRQRRLAHDTVDVHVEVAVQAPPPDGSSPASSATPRSCSGRRVGNSTTSRIEPTSASSITSRSMPMPRPTVGGRPYSRARR